MTTEEKLNNVLGWLTAMSFDRPELSKDLVEPLNLLSEAISEVENLSLSGVGVTLCEICNENNTEVITKHCRTCEEYIINGEHN